MRQVSEYFGELHEAGDPARVLRVIRNFMPVFDKTLEEVKVQTTPVSTASLLLWLQYGFCTAFKHQAHTEHCMSSYRSVDDHDRPHR